MDLIAHFTLGEGWYNTNDNFPMSEFSRLEKINQFLLLTLASLAFTTLAFIYDDNYANFGVLSAIYFYLCFLTNSLFTKAVYKVDNERPEADGKPDKKFEYAVLILLTALWISSIFLFGGEEFFD